MRMRTGLFRYTLPDYVYMIVLVGAALWILAGRLGHPVRAFYTVTFFLALVIFCSSFLVYLFFIQVFIATFC